MSNVKWLAITLVLLACGKALASTPSPTVTTKPCDQIKERFACKAREDCKWLNSKCDFIVTPPPTAPTTRAPTVPTTLKPTKSPVIKTPKPTKAPTIITKKPTKAPTVKTSKPTKSPIMLTPKPTKAPTLRKCNTFTARVGCVTAADRCEWYQNKCINIRTKRPTKSPTNKPTKAPTNSPTYVPTLSPSRAPTYPKKCKDFKAKAGCCGQDFAKGKSKQCVNNKVAPPGCRWRIKQRRPKEIGVCEKKPVTPAPTLKAGQTHAPTTSSPTKLVTNAPTKKETKSPTKTPTKRPTNYPTKKATKSPTSEYEYEYEPYGDDYGYYYYY